MYNKRHQIIIRILQAVMFLTITACSYFNKPESKDESTNNQKAIARYKDQYLYLSDISESLANAENKNDSLEIIQRMAQNWLRNKVLIDKALLNLGDEIKKFEKQIEDYRRDLIIYAYEQAYITQNLDTNVSTAEISEYYLNNKNNYQLRENIVVCDYAIFPLSTPKILEIKKNFFQAKSKKETAALEEAALKYARAYSRGDTNWYNFSEIMKIIPFASEALLSTSGPKQLTFEDEKFLYLLNIKQIRSKDSPAPLEYVSEYIRNTILNTRKLELLRQLEENLMKQALDQKNIEIYVKEKSKQKE
ncbi:hypothetical protein JCM31826_18830 [Thermaurantimonas aggregans]|uniref:PpiC domain-containing protein n=1 Tax=Thermaurantimonas aggregans TaxID=2173829 RepID=A0A401XN10_9FLAO|nr:hypothetical protein [Thermaurantimonas aggregans]MCX8149734.1 hypothetical protein [Thermaurantimonas aggregans]GCD78401.1 hypothetical protein JCM31826_18830 [Thermaurantimonas aggregans]